MNRRLNIYSTIALLLLAGWGCQSSAETRDDTTVQTEVQAEPERPSVAGEFESLPVSGLGFQRAVLSLNIEPSGEVAGVFRGGYQDKRFEVYLTGEVDSNGTLSAQGEGSDGAIRLEGPLEASGFSGEAAGEIFTEEFNLPVAAEPAAQAATPQD